MASNSFDFCQNSFEKNLFSLTIVINHTPPMKGKLMKNCSFSVPNQLTRIGCDIQGFECTHSIQIPPLTITLSFTFTFDSLF